MPSALDQGFLLDRQWHWLRGDMETSKRPTLLLLARLLESERVPYVVIGGIALQVHQSEPRTTLDIDLAVRDRREIPRQRLLENGFESLGSFEHSENWRSADGTPVQFSDDPAFATGLADPDRIAVGDLSLPVLSIEELLRAKLRAAGDPARRRSKRLQDLADSVALLELRPELRESLTGDETTLLDRLPR